MHPYLEWPSRQNRGSRTSVASHMQVGVADYVDLVALSQVTGGIPPYKFTLDPATPLPSGLRLSSGGIVSGTPSAAGSTTINFTVADSSGLASLVRRVRFFFV
jgi:putative Ig domain-containing protein